MRNLKHTIVALFAVSLVGSLAAHQAANFSEVTATKLTQETRVISTAPAVLPGDGDGETENFALFSNDFLKFAGKDAFILTTDGGNINLRAAADTESTILDVLDVGTQIKILSCDRDWFQVETDGYKGYVKAEFVTLDYSKVKEVLLASVMYQNGTVNVSSNVHGLADSNSLILDLVGAGSKVTILETTENGWHKVYFGDNYDIGYVSADNITIGDMVNRAEVNAKRSVRIASVVKNAKITTKESAVAVKLLPSAESETLTTLANGTSCKIISGGSNWTKIIVAATNEIGYVKTANVKQVVESKKVSTSKSGKSVSTSASFDGSTSGSALVAQASKYIGTRYVYGGTSPSGFDCSGLVQYSLRKLGVSVPRSSSSQYGCGTSVSKANLKPGDLVFFSRGGGISHVAIYAGNGQVIHAPRAGKRVCYQSLASLSGSLKYVGAKRVL
ncbi:MAG: C40 family peptidase [Clostridia bacterium]|nr:C40 family peptidase [Clostridia bacterium]